MTAPRTQPKAEQAVRVVLRHIRTATYRTLDFFTPYITHRRYLGFNLYYSRGTGLIDRIRFLSPKKIYEEELGSAIVAELKARPDGKVFVDIGANIGLISLYVLKYHPGVKIYAFEPGSHQRSQIETTVSANKISDKLAVFPYALSYEIGTADFSTSIDDRAVGGDGLLDTGRSLGAKKERVELSTLDRFCELHACVPDVIKIDIEGAELWALQGSSQAIDTHKPVVFFEMSPMNLKAYPYGAKEILEFFASKQYEVKNLAGTVCTLENFPALAELDDMFVGRPKA